jgi:hypothetical protein
MLLKVAALVLRLVTVSGICRELPSITVPKLSEAGLKMIGEAVADPKRLMKLREELESESISMASMWFPAV